MAGNIKNIEEFSFFNQQLSGMLKAGIPLEGALKGLLKDMRKGRTKSVFTEIHQRLITGEVFSDVIADMKEKLPPLYYQLCIVGEKSGRLPFILTKLASYYRWKGQLKGKLQVLMVYPAIVMITSIVISLFLTSIITNSELWELSYHEDQTMLYMPYYFIGFLIVVSALYITVVFTPWLRFLTDRLSWQFKTTKYLLLANFSYMLEALLASGVPLSDSLSLMNTISDNNITKKVVENIWMKVEQGIPMAEAMHDENIFPLTYIWILKNSGEQLPEGFKENAQTYGLRARKYIDICIYASIPIAMVCIGFFVLVNFATLFHGLISFMDMFYYL